MVTRTEVINEALEWKGTPWFNGQSVKGIGCNCTGFLEGVGKNTKFLDPNFKLENQPRFAREESLILALDKILIPDDNLDPANIIAIKRLGILSHVGIVLNDNEFIHSSEQNRVGVIVSQLALYKERNFIYKIYRIPNIEN